ncbi:hypothetical protein FJ872_19385 [Mesorhizobium sp. B2-5-9]|uniref:hypothetical protein n=1 Tax=Mesorhizobium sp. B2-5-9 TaxID=2589921 RepID=UPI00112E59B1|nr:hypothetical protein [Mesorhizobium sp. B2-5-9]TPK15163.1 hypothetical protein FJ872_19385 [Mesorhizobium sp. B2-5-9]
MTLATVNLKAANNEDWRLTLSLTADGDPVDLAGYAARMQVKSAPEDNAPLATLSTEVGGLTIDGSSLLIFLPADKTRGLRGGIYHYDLLLTIAGSVTRVCAGTITVDEGITR